MWFMKQVVVCLSELVDVNGKVLCLLHVLADHAFHRPRPFESSSLAVGDDVSHLQKAVPQVLKGKRVNCCLLGSPGAAPSRGRKRLPNM